VKRQTATTIRETTLSWCGDPRYKGSLVLCVLCGIKKGDGLGPFYFDGTISQTLTAHTLKEGTSEILDHKIGIPQRVPAGWHSHP